MSTNQKVSLAKSQYGFIIVRHVNSSITDNYWKDSYHCIRKYHDYPILIVDDNSNPKFLNENIELINCQVINSEFPKVGELLGYYYFYKTRFVEKCAIIHDSVFINSNLNLFNSGEVRSLWSFKHRWDNIGEELRLISYLKDKDTILKLYHNKEKWFGSFGIMNTITWNALDKINNRHNLFIGLLPTINTRIHRMALERVMACICTLNYPEYFNPPHIINDICDHSANVNYEQYKTGRLSHLNIIKVWTGR